VLQKFERWSHHADMNKYINVLEEWDEMVFEKRESLECCFLNPYSQLEPSLGEALASSLKSLICDVFALCQAYLKSTFTPFLQQFWENQQIDLDVFRSERLQ